MNENIVLEYRTLNIYLETLHVSLRQSVTLCSPIKYHSIEKFTRQTSIDVHSRSVRTKKERFQRIHVHTALMLCTIHSALKRTEYTYYSYELSFHKLVYIYTHVESISRLSSPILILATKTIQTYTSIDHQPLSLSRSRQSFE